MGHRRAEYEDRIRAELGDLGVLQLVQVEQVPLALEAAFATFSKDRPREASQTFDGDGTAFTFDLTDDITAPPWVPGWSTLLEVEYPAGERIPELMDPLNYRISSAGLLTLHEDTPSATEDITVRYITTWPFPTSDPDDDLVPEPYWHAICSLAASRLARGKAVEFARRRSSSVAGELITHDPGPLFQAAEALAAAYKETVLGRPATAGAPTPLALKHGSIDVFPDTLFHRRDQEAG